MEKVIVFTPTTLPVLLVAEAVYPYNIPIQSDRDLVWFCGQQFDVCSLLEISQATSYRPLQVAEFRELVGRLNGAGNAMLALRGVRSSEGEIPPVFFSNGEEHCGFGPALQRMTETTSWKLEFLPSRVNPGKGIDVRVIVPE